MTTQLILDLILAVFASSGIWTLILYIIQRRDKKKDDTTLSAKLILGLGHERIVEMCVRYIERGYITEREYNDLVHYLFEPYKALGGNGSAEELVKDVKKLQIKGGIYNEDKRPMAKSR